MTIVLPINVVQFRAYGSESLFFFFRGESLETKVVDVQFARESSLKVLGKTRISEPISSTSKFRREKNVMIEVVELKISCQMICRHI